VARRVKDSQLRRKLRRLLPDSIRDEIRVVMNSSADQLLEAMRANAPKDEGDMAEQAHKVVSRDGLSAKIGYGNQAGFRRQWKRGGFKALWQEYGTRFHGANAFIRPAFRQQLRSILDNIDAAVIRALRKATSKVG
jgi:hypothetical protein